MSMHAPNPEFEDAVEKVFADATFVTNLDIRLISVEPGRCEAALDVSIKHLQHLGRIHGGVVTTLAGHTALGAAMSVASSKAILVSPDFKMTMLRGSDSGELRASARVLKTGGALTFVEVDIVNNTGKSSKLIAKGSFTLIDSSGLNRANSASGEYNEPR